MASRALSREMTVRKALHRATRNTRRDARFFELSMPRGVRMQRAGV